jgi:predicted methyltransferase
MMVTMSLIRCFFAWAAISSALWSQQPPAAGTFQASDAGRENFQKATSLLGALQVSPGDWVADVGAGGGYYSMRLSHLVGSEGKVFAEEISDSSLRALTARVKEFDLKNVEIVKGDADDPKLPADRLSAVLIVDAYHHFTNHADMLAKILHALKPGGRLGIADYSFKDHRSQPRADQLKLHEIDPATVRSEVEQAGFQIVKLEDPFVEWRPGVGNTRSSNTDLWLLVAVRPK